MEQLFEVSKAQHNGVRIRIIHINTEICVIRITFAKIKEISGKWYYIEITVIFKSKERENNKKESDK
jgi:hypothetical protein